MKKIKKIISNLFLAPIPNVEGDIGTYVKAIEGGKFKNKLVYGISDKEKGFLTYDPVKNPGALYCGSMGSGKSIAMRFTVATHIATNSENTVYLLMDPLKGMTDYALLFDGKKKDFSKNVAHAVNDPAKIVPLIDMVFDEAMERKFLFSIFSSKHVYDIDLKLNDLYQEVRKLGDIKDEEDLYEKLINHQSDKNNWHETISELKELKEEKKLFLKVFGQMIDLLEKKEDKHPGITRIIICIEEFHKIPNSNYVKFNMQSDREGSIANKMKELMRIGRSYGIAFMFATQRGTAEDVPTSLKPGLSVMMCFKMSNPGEAGALNLPHANEIMNHQRGRCAYEEGFIQYPYLDDKPLEDLMNKYYKPLKSYFLKYDMEDYRIAFSGKGNSGMVKIKPFRDLIQFHNQFDLEDIIARILDSFNIKTEIQENKAYVADQIGIKGEDRYAIKIIKDRNDGTDKIFEALSKGAENLNCNKTLVIGMEFIPPSLSRKESDDFIVLDKDDLLQIANIFDNKEVLKREGSYNELYLQYPLSSPADLGLSEEESNVAGKKEDGLLLLDYKDILESKQDINAYVTNDKVKIVGMPDSVERDFLAKREEYKQTGKKPSLHDPLIDELISKKVDFMSEELAPEDKVDNAELKDKLSLLKKKLESKENKSEENNSDNKKKDELEIKSIEESLPKKIKETEIIESNEIDAKDESKEDEAKEEISDIENDLRNKLMLLKGKIEKEKSEKKDEVEVEKRVKRVKTKSGLRDNKKKKIEIDKNKSEIKLKQGLTKESILNLREELKKEILS